MLWQRSNIQIMKRVAMFDWQLMSVIWNSGLKHMSSFHCLCLYYRLLNFTFISHRTTWTLDLGMFHLVSISSLFSAPDVPVWDLWNWFACSTLEDKCWRWLCVQPVCSKTQPRHRDVSSEADCLNVFPSCLVKLREGRFRDGFTTCRTAAWLQMLS